MVPYLAGAALFILAAFALTSLKAREDETRDAMANELSERLADRIAVFEQGLLSELDDMILAASEADAGPHALQRMWRRQNTWFDALYVWTLTPGDASGPAVVTFSHPTSGLDVVPGRAACVARARAMAGPTALDLAQQLLQTCAQDGRGVRAYAALEAAQAIRSVGTPAAAMAALAVPDLDDAVPLQATPDVGESMRVARRLMRADLLEELGQGPVAQRIRVATVGQLLSLDAPALESTLFLVPGVMEDLAQAGVDTRPLGRQLAYAEQRLAAYREIRQLAARTTTTTRASEAARFTYDQYSDAPFLLYSRRVAPDRGVVLQLRQDALLDAFLAGGTRFMDQILVTDLSGHPVAGSVNADPSDLSAPFSESLRHLRAVLTADAVSTRLAPGGRAATITIGAVTLFCVVLGLGALWQQSQANRRQRLLLQRQRDFTARVTHELKTPLAGIKVMAENLALGAFRDEAQRHDMAERIIDEADRLTSRVEEILQVGRKRELPTPEDMDLEDILLELVEVWGPRYEQHGVRLAADMAPTEMVRGEPRAVRDAIACLLDNALKYRREDIESWVWLNTRDEPGWAEIEVVDNGLGVPPDQRSAIFERFVRVEGPNRGKSGGHGLGLAQVAEIVAQHGGKVTCQEGVDGGARFVVRLPVITSR